MLMPHGKRAIPLLDLQLALPTELCVFTWHQCESVAWCRETCTVLSSSRLGLHRLQPLQIPTLLTSLIRTAGDRN